MEEAGESPILFGYFIFSVKSSDGIHVDRFKARLVVDGSRVPNTVAHSPVIHPDSLRAVLAYAVPAGWHIHTVDIKDAYLNSPADQTVFMRQPDCYVCPDKPTHVCRLNKALFGLLESGHSWYVTFTSFIVENGFIHSMVDPCVIHSRNYDLYILLYVDDSAVTSPSIESFKNLLGKQFKFRDQGSIKKFLGIEFKYDREKKEVLMKTKNKIKKLVEEFRDQLQLNLEPVALLVSNWLPFCMMKMSLEFGVV